MVLNKLSCRRICRPEISIGHGLVKMRSDTSVIASSMGRSIKLNSPSKSWSLRLLDDGVVFLTELPYDQTIEPHLILQDSTNAQHYRLFVEDNGDVKTEIIIVEEEGGNIYA